MASAKRKGRGDDLKQEEILQAVVIADSFNVRFGPATSKKPRALLPLVNVPMLEYTLDYLASEGVQEALVFCCHLSDQIRAHISNSKWGQANSSMVVKTILADGCRSVGDVLREIDSRSLIRNDFFLLGCDTIANVNLKELMKDHKNRREQIKSSVMTMTYMKVHPRTRMRCAEDNVMLAVVPENQRICHYQRHALDRKIKFPMELFHDNTDFVLHQDLLDSQLYMCSPTVLHLFTDNFDYCSVEHFVKGILDNQEILGNTIHVNVLKDKYCVRVTNPYMYDVVSQDIIRCRTAPLTPQTVIGTRAELICKTRPNIYQSKGISLASGVHLRQNVVIGPGSSIQSKTEISDSVIGHNCRIGANVTIRGCYLWDNVTIEDGCVLKNAIVCDGVTVFANTMVQERTILSWNVKVGPDVTLPSNLRLQDTPQKDEFDDADDKEEEEIPEVTLEYGRKSRAFAYTQEMGSDDDGEQSSTDWGDQLVSLLSDEDEDGSFSDASSVTVSDLDGDLREDELDDFGRFYSEMRETLQRAKEERITTENLKVEINSLKYSYNIPISDVHQAVTKVLVEMPLKENPTAQGKVSLAAVLRHVESHKLLLKHYIKDKEAQLNCLSSLEDFAVENVRVMNVLAKVVHHLYNCDILDEQVITQWYYTQPESVEVEEHQQVRRQMAAFIKWLEEAEEESDEGEESDD